MLLLFLVIFADPKIVHGSMQQFCSNCRESALTRETFVAV
jgi:hypothetical protein